MEYSVFRIRDICEIKSGKRLPAEADFVDYKTNRPYIRARDIKDGKIKADNLAYIEDSVQSKIKKYIINSGDIAITIVGASVGDVGFALDEVNGFNLTENAVRLTEFRDMVDSRFLSHLLYQKQYHDYMQLIAGAAAQPKLGIYKIQRIKVQLPDITVQNRIADILSAYDELIENNNKRIKILEQMAENLYKEWFVRFRFPGHETAGFENGIPKGWALSTECNSIIPKGWHYGEFGELGKFVRGKNITSAEMIEGEVPVISAGLEPSGYHNEANVRGKSLTISASGANAGYMKYNLDDIWAADCSYYQSEKYLWFAYSTLKFLQPVISNLQCGAAQPHVHPKQINRLSVIIPSADMIHKYCNAVECSFEEIKMLKKKNDNLTRQRDLLLPRLMSGKLEV